MYFVFSCWYIVIAVLVLLSIGALVGFVLMDKKDREIIQDFLSTAETDGATAEAEVLQVQNSENPAEPDAENKEENKE